MYEYTLKASLQNIPSNDTIQACFFWFFNGYVGHNFCSKSDYATVIITGTRFFITNQGLSSTPFSIDFGNLTTLTAANKTDSVTIKNDNSYTATILSVAWQDGSYFTLDTPLEGLLLASSDSITAKITMNNPASGKLTDTLIIDVDYYGCGESKLKIPVAANISLPIHYNVKVSDNHNIPPTRQSFQIPISITSSKDAAESRIKKLVLSMNKQLFLPTSVNNGTMDLFYFGDSIEITISDIIIPPLLANNPVDFSSIKGDILLGSTDYTDILLKEILFTSTDEFTYTQTDGSLSLEICSAGDDRLVDVSNNNPGIWTLGSNVNGVLKVRCFCVENGNYSLTISNIIGNFTADLRKWNVTSNQQREFTFEFPIDDFANGHYYIFMETPTKRYYDKFVIVK